MKSNNIRTDVRTVRGGGGSEGPRLGKVGRLRGSGRPVEGLPRDSHAGRDRHAARMQKVIYRWSLILAGMTTLVIVVSSFMWLRAHRGVAGPAEPWRPAENVGIAARFAAPGEEEALGIVRQAMALRDPERVGGIIRPGEADAAEVLDFMAAADARDGALGELVWLGNLDGEGIQMEGVLVSFRGKTPPAQRLAMLVPDDSGVWKLDFEAFAQACRPPLKDLLQRRARSAVVRVLAARDTYFNGPFEDEELWANFTLTAPELQGLLQDGADTLRGYCRKDSPQAKALERIFSNHARSHRVTLEIRRDDAADQRQFEITRVLAADWVLAPRAYDGRFE